MTAEGGLVILDRQQVIGPVFEHQFARGQVLSVERVEGNAAPRQVQLAKQLARHGNFVGLDVQQGTAQVMLAGHGAIGQDQEAVVVHHQAQPAVALGARPTDSLIAVLEMLGGRAQEQQRHPAILGIEGHVVQLLSHRLESAQIVMLRQQTLKTLSLFEIGEENDADFLP